MLFGLLSNEWTVLHQNFYTDYEYTDRSQKVFANFEYTVHQIELDLRCRFSKSIFILRAHTLRGDLILQLRELELISNGSFIKLKFLLFNDYEIYITIILQTFFPGFNSGFLKGYVLFLIIKALCCRFEYLHNGER